MDDGMLALALRERQPAAVQELVTRYGDRLLRSAFLLCGSESEAQDLVQETFLQAVQSAPRFRGQSSLYTWLHGILLNLTRHYRRATSRVVYDEDLVSGLAGAIEEDVMAGDAELARSALIEALQQLSLPHREALLLRFYEDMKIDEMARHLGVSRGTVKSRLHYAIERMRELVPSAMNLFGPAGTEVGKQR